MEGMGTDVLVCPSLFPLPFITLLVVLAILMCPLAVVCKYFASYAVTALKSNRRERGRIL